MSWVSDREIRSLSAWQISVIWRQPGRHRPDLGIVVNGARVAVEVELTAKAASRLYAILAGYQQQIVTGRLAGILYITDQPTIAAAVERVAGAVGIDRRRLRLLPLGDLESETRALAIPAVAAPGPPGPAD